MASTISVLDQPFQEAIDFLKQKTATPTKSWRDVWDGAHSKMFMVAGAASNALVEDIQAEIAKALENGTTLADFRTGFDAIVKKHGWAYNGDRGWRTRTIFETNLRTAYAAGRYAQMTEPDNLATFPYWQYHHSGSLHPRLQHKAWDGLCLAADDPAWDSMYPPNGFGCGCFVTPVSRPGLRRLGKAGPDRSPDLDQLGTDQPLGVDPSFAYNPGKSWLDQTAPGPTPVSANEATVAAFIRSAARGKWPDGSWTPAGVVDEQLAGQLGVGTGTELRLLAETVRDLDVSTEEANEYAVVPRRLVRGGKVSTNGKGSYVVTKDVDGRTWSADLDVVKDGKRTKLHLGKLRSEEKR
ncbi:phage head morphogenesis protein [Rhizobium leguminosarum]